VLKDYKVADKKAPRYRRRRLTILKYSFYSELKKAHPEFKQFSDKRIRSIIKDFNQAVWRSVISYRDGVELMEQLGYIFIGTCKRRQHHNTDYNTSKVTGKLVEHQNWESDQFLQKIFYTNYETKYGFKFHEMWGFKACRQFKLAAANNYPKEWKKYIVIENMRSVSKLFRKRLFKQLAKKSEKKNLEGYDEFRIE
jgi:hypothetical protein